MGILFEYLDKYFMENELMNSWNKFEDLKKLRGNMVSTFESMLLILI